MQNNSFNFNDIIARVAQQRRPRATMDYRIDDDPNFPSIPQQPLQLAPIMAPQQQQPEEDGNDMWGKLIGQVGGGLASKYLTPDSEAGGDGATGGVKPPLSLLDLLLNRRRGEASFSRGGR